MKLQSLILLSTAFCVTCTAQTVINAESSLLQPQIGRDAGGFKTCGMRATVLVGPSMAPTAYDFSLNVYAETFSGMLKAGRYDAAALRKGASTNAPLRAVMPAPVAFWIAQAAQSVPLAAAPVIASDSPGFILGGGALGQTSEAILAMANGDPMQFAVRYKNEKIEKVVAFQNRLSQSDMDALLSCFRGLQERLESKQEK